MNERRDFQLQLDMLKYQCNQRVDQADIMKAQIANMEQKVEALQQQLRERDYVEGSSFIPQIKIEDHVPWAFHF